MTPLENELIDLCRYLDHGDGVDLAHSVLLRIGSRRRIGPPPTWLRVAAAVVLAIALVAAIPTTRRAVARLFGIGAIEFRPVEIPVPVAPSPENTVPGSVASTLTTSALAPTSAVPVVAPPTGDPLAAVRSQLTFTPRLAGSEAGPVRRVEVDTSIPGGILVITYDRFTLVELASNANNYPVMAKLIPPGTTSRYVEVGNDGGVWVEGVHKISYVAPDGQVRTDSVRLSDNALIWTPSGITLRIEGFERMEDALKMASTVR